MLQNDLVFKRNPTSSVFQRALLAPGQDDVSALGAGRMKRRPTKSHSLFLIPGLYKNMRSVP